MPDPTDPALDYRARAAAYHEVARAAERRSRWLERARLVGFVGGALAAVWTNETFGAAPALGVALVGAVVLAAIVVRHRRAREDAAARYRLVEVCERGEARVLRRWDRLPTPAVDVPADHAYAADLQVTGRASLWQLLDTVSAYPGRDALAAWLLDAPPPAETIRARQDAVRALAPLGEWREMLAAHALASGAGRRAGIAAFLDWAGSPPGALARPLPYAAACLAPLAFLGAALVASARPAAWPLAAAALGLNVLLAVVLRAWMRPAVRAATTWSAGLRQHAALLRHAAAVPAPAADVPRVAALVERLRAGGGAERAAARLERIAGYAEVRYSPMAYGVLQATLLWDLHVAAATERWRREAGAHVRGWLDALGELEALAALATLAHDHPAWTLPDVDDAHAAIDATALGHPLLADGVRVPNDVIVGPAGRVLLVTGSNMAGKSTLLRAVGANAVLAMAGAPVCAARLALPRVRPMTSVAVRDSLADETSLFLAELRRVKRIVDAARERGAPPALYLLDEVLHGTNSAERRVATRAVLSHLLVTPAIGAVSTHDLALAADEPLVSRATLVHFTETVHDGADGAVPGMTFDYRLRPGLATSTNALVLLRLMGLDERIDTRVDAAER